MTTRIIAAAFVGFIGFGSVATGGRPSVLLTRPRVSHTAVYEKLELIIELDADFVNPFDPEELDLTVVFTAPSGATHRVWGFYNPTTMDSLWMARFSPGEVGDWTYVVHVRDKNGTTQGEPGKFTAGPAAHHGFIKVAGNNRYLQYDDGSPFYGIGLWYNDGPYPKMMGNIIDKELVELKSRGVNFICSRVPPLETLASGIGRYDQDHCRRMDQIVEMCEKHDLHLAANIWFHNYLAIKPGMPWNRLNPYRFVCSPADFFSDTESWKYQEKMYRYMIARWGYSRAIFLWFIVDEANLTAGWRMHPEEGPKSVNNWARRVHDFFKNHDSHNRPTAGTLSGGFDAFWHEGCEIFDTASRELYGAHHYGGLRKQGIDPEQENPIRISCLAYATEIQKLWQGYYKPALFPELGAHSTFHWPGSPGYTTHYHNALWVGLANGLCATPFWWEYWPEGSDADNLGLIRAESWKRFNRTVAALNDSVVTDQLLHLRRFVSEIDLLANKWNQAKISIQKGDGWAMSSERVTFGWIVDPSETVAGRSLTIVGLEDGAYDVRFFRTWQGTFLKGETAECRKRKLTIRVPVWKVWGNLKYSDNDIAFRITRKPADKE